MTSQSQTQHLQNGEGDEQCYTMYTIDSCYERKEDRIIESFMCQDQVIDLELYIGASVCVINENTYNQLKNSAVLKQTKTILRTYSGEKIIPIGVIDVSVIYQNREHMSPFLVFPGDQISWVGTGCMKFGYTGGILKPSYTICHRQPSHHLMMFCTAMNTFSTINLVHLRE